MNDASMDGRDQLNIRFSGLDEADLSSESIKLKLRVETRNITTTDFIDRLSNSQYAIHMNIYGLTSSSPIKHKGYARTFECLSENMISAFFIIPKLPFSAKFLSLINIGFSCLQPVAWESWDLEGAWIALSSGEPELFDDYFTSFNVDRAP